MKIVYSWLKDFIDIEVPAQELADALTSAGLEVASIEEKKIPRGIKVARVLEKEKHPNADKLSLCKVDAGGKEPLQIVCGAPNVAAGMIVPLATEGTVIGPDFIIKKSKIRGIESFGMLCSEQELGLSDNHDGLMALPSDYKIGTELSEHFPDEAIIEVEITPDRGDCLSVLGVAREVSARFGVPLKDIAKRPVESADDKVESSISVTIEALQACPRYTGRLIRGVKIGPSPEWMQHRLTLAGVRPINNVVDVTNYLLIQYGQPMHSFDYSTIEDKKIIVKKAGHEMTFTTLDNVERKLIPEDLLICDGKRAVALAGVMGGLGSEITDSTTDVFLEVAFFDPIGVRKTSKRLGLSSDSSYRFERGVDPDIGITDALDTAAELIRQLAGGTVSSGRIDVYPEPFTKREIVVRPSRVSRMLGVDFSSDQITTMLSSLGLICERQNADSIRCTVPLFRHDLMIEVDLVEEVGRIYGYDNIPASEVAPVPLLMPPAVTERTTDTVRAALAYFGLNELVTNSLTSEKQRELLTPDKKPVTLLNPLNPDMALLRTTLAGSMLEALAYNVNRKNENNRFFELGKMYEVVDSAGTVSERDILGILIEGNYLSASWSSQPKQSDFYLLKGVIEAFAAHINIGEVKFAKCDTCGAVYENEITTLSIGKYAFGTTGKVAKKVRDFFDIKADVFYAEIDVTDLLKNALPLPKYKPLPRFPPLERDFCFVMSEELMSSVINDEIYSISDLVEDVRPFDVYRGDKLGAGKKSIAFSVKLRSSEKTLSDKETEAIHTEIVSRMKTKYSAELRS